VKKNKTTETPFSVDDFVNRIKDETKQKDIHDLITIVKELTDLEPKMWGPGIIGFGCHHYKYESGREGESPNFAFSPRTSSIALYLSGSFQDRDSLLKNFGKHKTENGCVHIKQMADINPDILKKMIIHHLQHIQVLYPENK
jgi:hypothetical protein